jgi:predicted nuclease of predicted toxin-antitoxin system
MKLWLDAQLSPEMAFWVTQQFRVETIAVRDVGLRNAKDLEIFRAAKEADVVLMTKDSDFSDLIRRFGAPPRVIWLRCGNTSNKRLRHIFNRTLAATLALIESGETLVEITDESAGGRVTSELNPTHHDEQEEAD